LDYRILVLALGTFAIGTDNYVVAGILPQVGRSFDVGVPVAGQFITVYALAYGLLTPVMAALLANWPRRRVLLSGLVIFVIGNILTATQTSFDLALLSRAVAGLGGAMFTPVAGATAAAMVAPERRGAALAIVIGGLSGATALGAPIGTLMGSASDWHMTMWFVSLIGTLALVAVFAVLPDIAPPPALHLRQRLAPLSDARVATTLLTTLLFMFGVFLIYTYISIVFDRATHADGTFIAVLMSSWGIAATAGNLAAGSLSDRFGSRRVINVALAVVALDFALMPWIGANFLGAVVAIAIWGFCGWGFVLSQQHRLVGISAASAPILLALNASAIYLAISAAGAAGALAIGFIDPHRLPLLTSVLVVASLFCAEFAYRLIRGTDNRPVNKFE
jgi:MFS transporter, DHA1 family, inner membrane transport protein